MLPDGFCQRTSYLDCQYGPIFTGYRFKKSYVTNKHNMICIQFQTVTDSYDIHSQKNRYNIYYCLPNLSMTRRTKNFQECKPHQYLNITVFALKPLSFLNSRFITRYLVSNFTTYKPMSHQKIVFRFSDTLICVFQLTLGRFGRDTKWIGHFTTTTNYWTSIKLFEKLVQISFFVVLKWMFMTVNWTKETCVLNSFGINNFYYTRIWLFHNLSSVSPICIIVSSVPAC